MRFVCYWKDGGFIIRIIFLNLTKNLDPIFFSRYNVMPRNMRGSLRDPVRFFEFLSILSEILYEFLVVDRLIWVPYFF